MKTTNDLKLDNLDVDIKDVVNNLFHYKRSILFILLSSLLMASYYLYFKTPVYISHALIEVKSSGTQGIQGGDFLQSSFSTFGKEKVDKDIEILQTFHIHNLAISNVDFHTQYFVKKWLKKTEIYYNIPIDVKNMTILYQDGPNITNKLIKLIPIKDGYHLQVENSFKDRMLHLLFNKKIVELDKQKIHHYGSRIKTDDFELTIEKKTTIDQPIYFTIKDNNRQIYEQKIYDNLEIIQINPAAPLIDISFKDTVPERADTYVEAVIKSFISQSIAEKSKSNDRIINFVKKQLSDMKTKLDNSEKKLEEYRIKHQAIDPTLQAETYITESSKIDIELSQNDLKKSLIIDLLKFSKSRKDLDTLTPYLIELDDNPTLVLITKLQDLQIDEEGLKAQYSAKHPGLIALRKQIRTIKNKIILNIQNLESSMSHRNKNLKKLKKLYDEKIKSLPTQERILINLKRDYEVSSETYNYLLKKKSENEMLKVAVLSDYRIVNHAYCSGVPISPNYLFTIIATLLLGLILGLTQALMRNLLNDKIQSRQDVEKLTSLPIYGILPLLKQKVLKLEVFKDTRSPFAESYRSLRTNLQFALKESQANVILVTSTIAGEGKTTTTANLGAVFQMANNKVIVINLDMRKPTLHTYFDVANDTGMSTYLSGKNSIEEIIQSTQYTNLDIISSGPIPPNPSELILTDRLDELLDALKEEYDYIFIDSSPLGLVTDTMHLMQYADISLIIFRESYAKKSFVTNLNDLISRHNLKHIGLMINSADVSSGTYGYGYGYGYGNE